MRREFPERHALRNRLHYLLTRQRGFALWQNEERKLIAGFTLWQGRKPEAAARRLDELMGDEGILAWIERLRSRGRQEEMSDLIAEVFNRLGSPVEFDRLVSALSSLLQIRHHPLESTDEEKWARELPSREADPAWRAEKRIFLQRMWEEVRQLPPNQRAALLLNRLTLRHIYCSGCCTREPGCSMRLRANFARCRQPTRTPRSPAACSRACARCGADRRLVIFRRFAAKSLTGAPHSRFMLRLQIIHRPLPIRTNPAQWNGWLV